VELRGFEPLTFALPARRSSQLSYSPVELVLLGKINAREKVATADGSRMD
jgi:hypothetical protein